LEFENEWNGRVNTQDLTPIRMTHGSGPILDSNDGRRLTAATNASMPSTKMTAPHTRPAMLLLWTLQKIQIAHSTKSTPITIAAMRLDGLCFSNGRSPSALPDS
jgi:hypothetical protein